MSAPNPPTLAQVALSELGIAREALERIAGPKTPPCDAKTIAREALAKLGQVSA
jgi:hypothetical protein